MQIIKLLIAFILGTIAAIIWAVWCLIKTIICIPLIIYYMATKKDD